MKQTQAKGALVATIGVYSGQKRAEHDGRLGSSATAGLQPQDTSNAHSAVPLAPIWKAVRHW